MAVFVLGPLVVGLLAILHVLVASAAMGAFLAAVGGETTVRGRLLAGVLVVLGTGAVCAVYWLAQRERAGLWAEAASWCVALGIGYAVGAVAKSMWEKRPR